MREEGGFSEISALEIPTKTLLSEISVLALAIPTNVPPEQFSSFFSFFSFFFLFLFFKWERKGVSVVK